MYVSGGVSVFGRFEFVLWCSVCLCCGVLLLGKLFLDFFCECIVRVLKKIFLLYIGVGFYENRKVCIY